MEQPSGTTKIYRPWPFLGPPQSSDEIGRLAQYRVLKVLGQGGMGVVFQAEDEQLRRPAALKVMRPEIAAHADARARFLREARAAAHLKHDHIVTIYQVGEHDGVPFLAMESLAGKSLEDWLGPDRRATVAEALTLGKQIARGLAAAHAAGLIHRDIKPANLWLEAPRGRVKILDFGLARHMAGELTALTLDGAVVGTPAFMAPEQARGEPVDRRCDLFSFGCVLYRMVTGRLPFQGRAAHAVLAAIASENPPSARDVNPDVPPRLAALIDRLLAKDPAGRPASAQAALDELTEIEKGPLERPAGARRRPPQPVPETQTADLPAPPDRIPWRIVAVVAPIGVVLLAVVVLLVWNPFGKKGSDPAADKAGPAIETKAATPAVAAPVDLLALIDPALHSRKGSLIRAKNGKLRARFVQEKEGFNFALPWEPPARYRLKMTVTRLNATPDQFGVILVMGDSRGALSIDWYDPGRKMAFTGMGSLQGRNPSQQPDARKGQVLVDKVPTTLTLTVEPGHVALDANGRRLYQWQGEVSSAFKEARGRVFTVYGVNTADFLFDAIVLEPLGPDAGQPPRPKD